VSFTYEGYAYRLDLCEKHSADVHAMIDALTSWSSERERVTRSSLASVPSVAEAAAPRRPARRDREQVAAIRNWARANGYEVSDRGRIPAEVEAAYNAAGRR
jgi:hypothetical protein